MQASRYRLKTASAARKAAVPVMGLGYAVNAYPDLHAEFLEQAQIGFAQADAIRLHPQINVDSIDRSPDLLGEVGDQITSGQQRLAAVQNQRDSGQAMRAGMLSNSISGSACDLD
jgi:hypothetical protein